MYDLKRIPLDRWGPTCSSRAFVFQVDRNSSAALLKGQCNHLTLFGGSVFVAPNELHPKEAFNNFLRQTDNLAVIAAIASIILLYVFGAVLARRTDCADYGVRRWEKYFGIMDKTFFRARMYLIIHWFTSASIHPSIWFIHRFFDLLLHSSIYFSIPPSFIDSFIDSLFYCFIHSLTHLSIHLFTIQFFLSPHIGMFVLINRDYVITRPMALLLFEPKRPDRTNTKSASTPAFSVTPVLPPTLPWWYAEMKKRAKCCRWSEGTDKATHSAGPVSGHSQWNCRSVWAAWGTFAYGTTIRGPARPGS